MDGGLGNSESGEVKKSCVLGALWLAGSLDLIPGAIDDGLPSTGLNWGEIFSPRGSTTCGGTCDSPQHLITHPGITSRALDFPFSTSYFIFIFVY